MKPFLYCVVLHPTEDDAKTGKVATILQGLTLVLAKDLDQAKFLAGTQFNPLDRSTGQLEVFVRPF